MHYPFTPPPKICAIFLAHRHKGSAFLALVLVMSIVSSLFSLGSAKVTQAAMNGTSSNKTSLQAQQYVVSEAALLQAVPYSDLKASAKAEIPNSSYFTETSLSSESNYTDTTKKRTATIHIYYGNETVPRASLAVDRYSVEPEKISVIPIGTVIAFAGNGSPSNDGTWLECNGQSCARYPKLVSVLGKSTLPDYRNRFLEGSGAAGTVIEAGLPNITGTFGQDDYVGSPNYSSQKFSGAFYSKGYILGGMSKDGSVSHGLYLTNIDASRCSLIYGRSSTVQPPAVTVRYFIKAA